MKTLLALVALTIAIALPAASPPIEHALGVGSWTNNNITLEINPETAAILREWDKQFAELSMKTNSVPGQTGQTLHGVPVVPPPVAGKLYVDTFTSISTPDFSHGEDWSYGVGVGYQINPTLSGSLRVTHAGLHFENNAISTVGGRLESRLPWEFLAPYGFLGAAFDLGPDQWRLLPGIGIEIGASKLLKGMSVFAEGGPDVDLKGHNTWLFSTGLRWRF